MPLIDWNPSFATGVDLIDLQHQHLFRLVNNFYDAAMDNSANVKATLEELFDYTRMHFNIEEQEARLRKIEGIEEHKEKHGWFIHQLEILAEQSSADHGKELELAAFVGQWLVEHVAKSDRDLFVSKT